MRIKKTSQYMQGGASLSNVYGTSNSDGYTQEYINGLQEVDTGSITSTNSKVTLNCNYYKVGRVVNIIGEAKISTSDTGAWASMIMNTLPQKLWPYRTIVNTVARDTDGKLIGVGVGVSGSFYLSARGRATLTQSAEGIPFNLTYIAVE